MGLNKNVLCDFSLFLQINGSSPCLLQDVCGICTAFMYSYTLFLNIHKPTRPLSFHFTSSDMFLPNATQIGQRNIF